MTTQDFALNASATERIKVHWTTPDKDATVLINGTILGMLTEAQERMLGKNFVLPNGSPLFVRIVENQPQVFLGQYPLVPVAAPPEQLSHLQGGKWPRRLFIGLIISLVLVSFSTLVSFAASFAILFFGSAMVLSFFLLMHAFAGCAGIGGLSLLLAKKKIGFFMVIGYSIANVVVNLLLGLIQHYFDWVTLIPLITIISLYVRLNRHGIWGQLTD